MNDQKYKNSLGFTDLIFNILIGVFMMFFIAFILIKPENKIRNVDSLVQYRITIEWKAGNNNDVDLWVRDPIANLAWYSNRDVGMMHLDRDDRGNIGDFVIYDGKVISSDKNFEIFSIRKTIPGEYIANIHLFGKVDVIPTKVVGKLIQVDPYKVLQISEIWLAYIGEEKLLFRFTFNEKGDIISNSKKFTSIVTGGNNAP